MYKMGNFRELENSQSNCNFTDMVLLILKNLNLNVHALLR